ncbi:MAG TPA: M36 family metallopeptidase [Ferruginibacter sp.]|nr:M36 family metallopeptidase [Ferruginibacter sp.]
MNKKILLFVLFSTMYTFAVAQVSEKDKQIAVSLVQAHAAALKLTPEQIGNMEVSSSYADEQTGIRYVYMQQTYQSLQVHNRLLVLSFKNDKLLSQSGTLVDYMDQRVSVADGKPSVSPDLAVRTAIADRKYPQTATPVVLGVDKNGQRFRFGKLDIAEEDITATLKWLPSDSDKSVRLVWEVYIVSALSSDYWLVYVDALNNTVVHIDNLTVYENGSHHPHGQDCSSHASAHATTHTDALSTNHTPTTSARTGSQSPELIVSAKYRVIPFPAENPEAPGGAPALVTNPWLTIPGNATTLNWHTGLGGTNYNYTRGNNVWAYHDRTSLNTALESKSAPSKDLILSDFDYVPDFNVGPTQTTPVQNQQFNITNVFYWSNIIHNVMYQYGFTEAAGNFQEDNLGRGGLGNDYVRAEAQDAGGINNANFATPVDGSLPRMQMYLWDLSTPFRDGDVDNGVIVHEYAHGISNRLTGGPNQASCLSNAEHMGEGWSDYYSMMFTQNWATSNLNTGFTTQRTLGLYALNGTNLFPASPPGTGIRNYPYSTNMAISPQVYTASLPTSPHTRGEVWAATLWDMTWNIIQQVGTINPNIYDVSGGGGNVIALRLVTEGMKLQPCSPGFIDGRNAILQADMNLYGGAYQCAIKEAFRRRGMGSLASQGSSSSVTDQVPDYSLGDFSLELLQNNVTATPEGNNIYYTNRLTTDACQALTNYILTDTLPLTVTFVSANAGGTYNPATRVVSWTINQAVSSTADYNFEVKINAGAYFPPIELIDENVPSNSVPSFWTPTSTTATQWIATDAQSKSAPYSFFSQELATVSDQMLTTTNAFALPATPLQLVFWHRYSTESGYDGGVVEISLDGGTNWADIGSANFIENGYNRMMNASAAAPLASRLAFSGNVANFIRSVVDLSSYTNENNVKLRFRSCTDNSVTVLGWYVDDISIKKIATIDMRSALYTSLSQLVLTADTTMVVLAPTGCETPEISSIDVTQPGCDIPIGGTIEILPTGSEVYEYSIDGETFHPNALFTGLPAGEYNVTVRVQSNPDCSWTYPNNPIIIQAQPSVPGTPGEVSGPTNVCPYIGNSTVLTYSVEPVAGATSYQWVVPPTVTLISGQGTNSITVTVNSNFLSSANRMFRVTATSNCGTSAERLFWLLAQFPTTPAPIQASSTDICSVIGTPNTITYSIPKVAHATSYIWSAQPGTTTISHPQGVGVNDTIVEILFTPGFTSSVVSVTAVNDCGVSGTRSLNIQRVNPSTPGLISGPTNVCEYIAPGGSSATYSVTPQPNVQSYNWTLPVGATSIIGQGTHLISFIYPVGYTGGSISVEAINGCGISAARTLNVSVLSPGAPSAIDVTPISNCPVRIYQYGVATSGNTSSIQWQVPAGATLLSGQGTNTIQVEYPAGAISGEVRAQSVNNCGSSAARVLKIKLPACPENPPTYTKAAIEEVQPFTVRVSPNPTAGMFQIHVEALSKEKIQARILNIHGMVVEQFNIVPGLNKQAGGTLKTGVYFLEVQQGMHREVKKLIRL